MLALQKMRTGGQQSRDSGITLPPRGRVQPVHLSRTAISFMVASSGKSFATANGSTAV
jgi:hypothetical protein